MVKSPSLKVGKKPLVCLIVNEKIGKAAVAVCEPTILDFE
jgi:hypothetical protein